MQNRTDSHYDQLFHNCRTSLGTSFFSPWTLPHRGITSASVEPCQMSWSARLGNLPERPLFIIHPPLVPNPKEIANWSRSSCYFTPARKFALAKRPEAQQLGPNKVKLSGVCNQFCTPRHLRSRFRDQMRQMVGARGKHWPFPRSTKPQWERNPINQVKGHGSASMVTSAIWKRNDNRSQR